MRRLDLVMRSLVFRTVSARANTSFSSFRNTAVCVLKYIVIVIVIVQANRYNYTGRWVVL